MASLPGAAVSHCTEDADGENCNEQDGELGILRTCVSAFFLAKKRRVEQLRVSTPSDDL